MIRFPRHDPSALREEDGAVEFRIFAHVSFRIYVFSALVNSSTTELLAKGGGPKKRFQYCVDPHFADTILNLRAKRRWSQAEISVLPGSLLSRDSSLHSSNSRPLEQNTSTLHCKTTCCCRATSPSTSTTLEAPATCTPSSNQDRFRVKKMSRKGDTRCSLRP